VEHRLDLVAKICDRMIVIDKGKIIFEGNSREILSKADVNAYGITVPAIVKVGKELGLLGNQLPLDAEELSERLVSNGRT